MLLCFEITYKYNFLIPYVASEFSLTLSHQKVYQIGDTSNSLHFWFWQLNVLLLKWLSFLVSHKPTHSQNVPFFEGTLYTPAVGSSSSGLRVSTRDQVMITLQQ